MMIFIHIETYILYYNNYIDIEVFNNALEVIFNDINDSLSYKDGVNNEIYLFEGRKG